ncbi:hypothetical protein C8R44DRAFT_750935 [Mycena epipterygia]|nr:hypothetical protein C8R44DRAFT_750935 [Mycena epipterygia]
MADAHPHKKMTPRRRCPLSTPHTLLISYSPRLPLPYHRTLPAPVSVQTPTFESDIAAGKHPVNDAGAGSSRITLPVTTDRQARDAPALVQATTPVDLLQGLTNISESAHDQLNSRYEYVGFKPSHTFIPDHILACKCEDYVSFLSAFNYMKICLLSLLAKSHGLPESARRSTLTAGFRDHKCATTCRGNDNLLYFKSLMRPRTNIIQSPHTPTADISTVVFNNTPADSDVQPFTTFELNHNYDLVDVGDLHSINDTYSQSAEHTICYCPSLAQFGIHYLSLSTAQLLTLSCHHRIQVREESNKPFLIQQFSRHDCANHCSPTYLVFIKRLYPHATPFVPHNITPVVLPTQALTLTEMADLNVLAVIFNNKIQFTAVAPHCIASLVSMYDHFTLSQLIDIAKHHCVPVSRHKPEQTISVLSHHCMFEWGEESESAVSVPEAPGGPYKF